MDSEDKPRPEEKKEKAKDKKEHKIINLSWTLKIVLITFIISFSLSYLSESALAEVSLFPAILVLVFFILVGVLFDLLGTAVTAADNKTFNSMAAKKVEGAKASLFFISKAATVSNFCNDVIGDICSVVSGTMCAVLASELTKAFGINILLTTLLITALTASLTVGLKSIGKNFSMIYNEKIIYGVARVCCLIIPERIFDEKNKKR